MLNYKSNNNSRSRCQKQVEPVPKTSGAGAKNKWSRNRNQNNSSSDKTLHYTEHLCFCYSYTVYSISCYSDYSYLFVYSNYRHPLLPAYLWPYCIGYPLYTLRLLYYNLPGPVFIYLYSAPYVAVIMWPIIFII